MESDRLDRVVFSQWFAMLAQRYGRELSTPMAALYYRLLASRMTTAEFQAAAVMVMESSRFFPTPEELLTAGRPSPVDEATLAWSDLMAELAGSGPGPQPSPALSRALAAVGGRFALRANDAGAATRRAFIDTFTAARAEEQRAESKAVVAGLLESGWVGALPG